MGVYTPSSQSHAQMMTGQYVPHPYYPNHYPNLQASQGTAPITASVTYPSINAPGVASSGMNNTPNLIEMHQRQAQSTTPYVHGLQLTDGANPVHDSDTAI